MTLEWIRARHELQAGIARFRILLDVSTAVSGAIIGDEILLTDLHVLTDVQTYTAKKFCCW